MLSYLSTGTFNAKVVGMNEISAQYAALFGPGTYYTDVRLAYWCMRVMAYGGLAGGARGAWWEAFLYRRRKLESSELVFAHRDVVDRPAIHRIRSSAGC